MNDSKNEQAWNQLFEKYNIDEIIKKEGQYIIKSKDINEFREARLMTKFDYRFQLPKILANKHLSISRFLQSTTSELRNKQNSKPASNSLDIDFLPYQFQLSVSSTFESLIRNLDFHMGQLIVQLLSCLCSEPLLVLLPIGPMQ